MACWKHDEASGCKPAAKHHRNVRPTLDNHGCDSAESRQKRTISDIGGQVAENLKSSDRKVVWVRVPPPAPGFYRDYAKKPHASQARRGGFAARLACDTTMGSKAAMICDPSASTTRGHSQVEVVPILVPAASRYLHEAVHPVRPAIDPTTLTRSRPPSQRSPDGEIQVVSSRIGMLPNTADC